MDVWFDRPAELRGLRPASGGWTIDEILEHIMLTNRFLLLTCDKHRRIALRRFQRGDTIPEGESDLAKMIAIGQRGAFVWKRPQHMEPSGQVPLEDVRRTLNEQWHSCTEILASLADGKGALCAVMMTVNSLGKIDLYQWLYFLAMHAKRHGAQMREIEAHQEVSDAHRS